MTLFVLLLIISENFFHFLWKIKSMLFVSRMERVYDIWERVMMVPKIEDKT